MIDFVTINILRSDIMNTIRAGQITQSEPLSFRYIESLIHQVRSVLLKRDIDKGIEIMSYTIQERRKGIDYQWTEPYSFYAERKVTNAPPITLEYR